MTEYRLLSASSADEMTSLVTEAIKQGWELYLGLVTDDFVLYQWIVKKPEDQLTKLLNMSRN